LLSAARAHTTRLSRRKPERETRIPGLVPEKRVPKSAGPVGGNEAMSRTPMTERTSRGPQWRRAVLSAATELFVIRFAAHHAAEPTLVVKMSDASRPGNSGFDSRL